MNNDMSSLDKKLSYLEKMKDYLSKNPDLSLAEIYKIAAESKKHYDSFEAEVRKRMGEFKKQRKELEKIIGSLNRKY